MGFGSVITAMVTPFDEKGQVDFEKLPKLIDHLIENGSEALVVGGTTGESATLSEEEKAALYQQSVKAADGRVSIIAGTGMNDTHATAELTVRAERVGVDGIMLVAPYYNKPSQKGLYEHFRTVAEKTSLPVMLYNVPGRTVVNLLPETVIELAKIPNITCVKEASGNLEQVTTIVDQTPDDFLLYSGDDSLTLPCLSVGGDGVVSVVSHVAGKEMGDMIRAYQAGDVQKAAEIHQRLLPVMKSMFVSPSPAPVKTALQMKGMDVGGVRLPLVPLTSDEREKLYSAVMNE
ncbi:4-hydroxy-tetrahydrodipicolinate synthase [Salisediminibacterium halotolerans]|uniref:4-hydroxy-tetrahydrodipicolinate synthase n=1 Tax=Salisediminibacterium halotolerans TaxID=517425 RepID=A0A1H9Q9L6_9BACI|nr:MULTISPECIES: 4-hydroxy-tetrahydrodipicolinate synthase [Salisediminibacterium]RLJ74167.1 4-hydroxy-tetrahydrodipicolinate synthase [Actinophytocola xinjiangensis]RPE87740.1 4-hydroxy-tetrahydrodipicolinate synthase [Salisediminibacterium halotolerans]TWG35004.1 4-hydroxy-tetrahydrodipicolinate synthase [Salisediminibacterium halotolerans]SER57130.1 4-hydroxy-tetrahydrodipicolinate synthase [Salisediminibacterium haloalkalitolerans]GEL06709.1 4-hydroxy-tetrahydrodipicolinate synthase [Salis